MVKYGIVMDQVSNTFAITMPSKDQIGNFIIPLHLQYQQNYQMMS